jgi:hypothetical protein
LNGLFDREVERINSRKFVRHRTRVVIDFGK